MNKIVEQFINSEAEKCLGKILELIPKTRHEDAKKLFFDSKATINSVFSNEKIYLRYRDGKVATFKSVHEIAQNIDYSVITLENYFRKGQGYFEFGGYVMSIIPIDENIITQYFWFRDCNGRVQKFDSLENLSRVCGLKVNSLELYLRKGKGFAQTKRGHISKTPLEELSFQDAYSLNFFHKHNRWPDINEIPHDPTDKRRY